MPAAIGDIRLAEVDVVNGNARKARAKLGWEPAISLKEMIREMVDVDLERGFS
jgi:GDPmannose 4,6-dehydratase